MSMVFPYVFHGKFRESHKIQKFTFWNALSWFLCVCFRLGNTMDVLQSLWQLIARPADSDELHIINLTLKTNNLTSSSTGTPTADHIWLQQTLSNIRMTFLPLVASCFFPYCVFFSSLYCVFLRYLHMPKVRMSSLYLSKAT